MPDQLTEVGADHQAHHAVRVEVLSGEAPQDLRVDLVDPGTSPADTRRRPLGTAEAAEPQPAVVTRAEWGADESLKKCVSGYTGTPRVAFAMRRWREATSLSPRSGTPNTVARSRTSP